MQENRSIFKEIENIPPQSHSLQKPDKPSIFPYKTVSFNSLSSSSSSSSSTSQQNREIINEMLEKTSEILPQQFNEDNFQVLLEQNSRLIGIVNEIISEKEQIKQKFEDFQRIYRETHDNSKELLSLQANLQEVKAYFSSKLQEVIKENQALLQEIGDLREKNEFLQQENANLQENLARVSQKTRENVEISQKLRAKDEEIRELQEKIAEIREKYQDLYKESRERLKTLSFHYEESRKSLENELESAFSRELRDEHKEKLRITEKLRLSEEEIRNLKQSLSEELDDLSAKYCEMQAKYKENEEKLRENCEELEVF